MNRRNLVQGLALFGATATASTVPMVEVTDRLNQLFQEYLRAKAAYKALPGDDPRWEVEIDKATDLAWELFGHPCNTLTEVQKKARFILADDAMVDLAIAWDGIAVDLLKSIAGDA